MMCEVRTLQQEKSFWVVVLIVFSVLNAKLFSTVLTLREFLGCVYE